MIFRRGSRYSRSDIGETLGLGAKAKGGTWASGIREHQDEFFIFAVVQTPGTVGAEHSNKWEGELLRWHHKKNSSRDWPSVRKLLDAGRAHVFWRTSTGDLFEYAGFGAIVEIFGTAPVGIVWSFDDASSGSALGRQTGAADRDQGGADVSRHEFEVGVRVRHPDLGLGRVLTISGPYSTDTALVYFAGVGERREIPLSEVEKVAGFGPSR